MTNGKRSSLPAKLIGLAAVVAGVVFNTNKEHCELDCLNESSRGLVVVYPVDRYELSQSILPDAREVKFQKPATATLTLDTLDAIAAPGSLIAADEKGPSAYERKLADQQAWGSLQRQVDLATHEKRSAVAIVDGAALKIAKLDACTNADSDASSNVPLVPGIEDPHLFYEDASASDVAISGIEKNTDESNIPIELAEGSFDFSAPIEISLLPSLPKTKPAFDDPAALKQATKTAASIRRTARAWETGRY